MKNKNYNPISLSLFIGALSGVNIIFPLFYFVYSMFIQFFQIFYKQKTSIPAMLIYFYIAQCLLSGIIYGGLSSINTQGLFNWLSNEGRVFVYFLPGLAILQSSKLGGYWSISMLMVSLFIFSAVIVRNTTGYQIFTSHHAAGAFSTVTIAFYLSMLRARYSLSYVVGLLLSILALLGSNSRTSLIALLIAIIIINIRYLTVWKLVKYIFVIVCFAFLAASMFENQVNRLQNLSDPRIYKIVKDNLSLAARSEQVELSSAWDASEYANTAVDANVAIRGFLFGQAIGHFIRSPLVGIGFGRFNDVGKEFTGERGLYYVASKATHPSPSNFTAHNTYLHILAETGLVGFVILITLFCVLYLKIRSIRDINKPYYEFGVLNLLVLLLMGFTQHSIGAPIFGFSNFAAICWVYTTAMRGKIVKHNVRVR